MARNTNPGNNKDFIYAFIVLIGAFLYYLSYFRYGITQTDEGLIWEGVERMMRGQRWNEDFFIGYGVMRLWVPSKLFAVFGESFIVFRVYFILLRLAGLAFMMAVAMRLMPRAWALSALIPAILLPGLIFKSDLLLFSMALLWLMIKGWESPSYAMVFLIGLVAGFSMWFRTELIGPVSIYAVVGLELGRLINPGKHPHMWRCRIINIAGVGISALALMILFPGVFTFIKLMVGYANGFSFSVKIPFPSLSNLFGNADGKAHIMILWGVILIYSVIGCKIIIGYVKNHESICEGRRLLILIMGILTTYNFIYQPSIGHILPGAAPAYILLADSLRRIWTKRNIALKTCIMTVYATAQFLFIIYSFFLCRNTAVNSYSIRYYMKTPIDSELGRIYFNKPRAQWINDVVKYIRANTDSDALVATLHEPFIISVLARRQNPLVFIPPWKNLLAFTGEKFYDKHYKAFLKSDLIVYYENPYRLRTHRDIQARLKYFDPLMYEFMLRKFTFVNKIGDYIILKRGGDGTGATRAFIEGWYEYRYGNFEKASDELKKARELGVPERFISPLLDDMGKRASKNG